MDHGLQHRLMLEFIHILHLFMESFEALKNLLDNSSTFYLISVDMDSTYRYVNSLYSKVFEPQHGNLIGKNYAVTMHHDDTQVCETVGSCALPTPIWFFRRQ